MIKYLSYAIFLAQVFSFTIADPGDHQNIESIYDVEDLSRAIRSSNIDEIQRIINGGIDIDEHDDCGRTPIQNAVRQGSIEITKMLLEAGANPNIKPKDKFQLDTLTAAIVGKHSDIVLLLIEHGCCPTLGDSEDYNEIVNLMIEAGSLSTLKRVLLLKIADYIPKCAELYANYVVERDNTEVLDTEAIQEARYKFNRFKRNNMDPIIKLWESIPGNRRSLSRKNDDMKSLKVMQEFAVENAERQQTEIEHSKANDDKLFDVVIKKDHELLKNMLNNGANPNVEDEGMRPIDYAIERDDLESVIILLSAKATVSENTMTRAVQRGNLTILSILVFINSNAIRMPNESFLRNLRRSALNRQKIEGIKVKIENIDQCIEFLKNFYIDFMSKKTINEKITSETQILQESAQTDTSSNINPKKLEKRASLAEIMKLGGGGDTETDSNIVVERLSIEQIYDLLLSNPNWFLSILSGSDINSIEFLLHVTDPHGNTLLHLASALDQIEIVKAIIKHLDNDKESLKNFINRLNNNGEPAIYLAVRNNSEQVVEFLFNLSETDISSRGTNTRSIMYYAVQSDNVKIVDDLIKRKIEVYVAHLLLALEVRNISIFSLLLEHIELSAEDLQFVYDVLIVLKHKDPTNKNFYNKALNYLNKKAKAQKIKIKKRSIKMEELQQQFRSFTENINHAMTRCLWHLINTIVGKEIL